MVLSNAFKIIVLQPQIGKQTFYMQAGLSSSGILYIEHNFLPRAFKIRLTIGLYYLTYMSALIYVSYSDYSMSSETAHEKKR